MREIIWVFLHSSQFTGHDSVVRILLEKGANVNAADANGDLNEKIEMFWFEIGRFFVFDFTVPLGNSPLHLVVQSNNRLDMARLLIKNGATLNAVNGSGSTPLETAIDRGKSPGINVWWNFWFNKVHLETDCVYLLNYYLENESLDLLLQNGAVIPDGAISLAASKGIFTFVLSKVCHG